MSTTVSRNEIFLYPSICILETTKILWISISVYQTLVYFLLNVLNLGHTCQQNFNNTYNDCQTKEYIVKCLQMTELYLHSNRIHPHIYLLLCFCLHRRTKTNPSKPRSETSMISIWKYIRRQRIWRSWGKVSEWQISLLEATYLMIFGWDASIKNCELLQHLPMTHPYCHQSCPCKLGRFKANC